MLKPIYKRRVMAALRRSREAHLIDDDDGCWCQPELIHLENDALLIVHNDVLLEH